MNFKRTFVNKDIAYMTLRKYMSELFGFHWSMSWTNKDRHVILNPVGDAPSFYCMYKKEWFFKFNFEFPEFVEKNPEYRGYGQSINKDYLDLAQRKGIDYIAVIMLDGNCYVVHTMIWKKFVEKHKLFRQQNIVNKYKKAYGYGKTEAVRENTYCLPIKLFKSMESEFECKKKIIKPKQKKERQMRLR